VSRFLQAAIGIFLLTAAFQMGAMSTRAEWAGPTTGRIWGVAQVSGARIFDAQGQNWFAQPGVGFRQDTAWMDFPIPVSDVKILDGGDGQGSPILVSIHDEVWVTPSLDNGWQHVGVLDPPTAVGENTWGKVKSFFRK
jgi:hypothetical protein